jgi:hypothetical protein
MIGKRLNDYDQFAKRQTASGLLKSNAPEKTETTWMEKIGRKLEAATASLSDPHNLLVDRLAKRREPIRATNAGQLCKDTNAADDKKKPKNERSSEGTIHHPDDGDPALTVLNLSDNEKEASKLRNLLLGDLRRGLA